MPREHSEAWVVGIWTHEVMAWIHWSLWISSGLSLITCTGIQFSFCSAYIYIWYDISHSLHGYKLNCTLDLLPTRLHSSVSRALHQYHRGHVLESCWSLFSGLPWQLQGSLSLVFSICSAYIWSISFTHDFSQYCHWHDHWLLVRA